MIERIRRRLTLGYVGIFALILLLVGAVGVASFSQTVAAQQDELLEKKAQGDADFVVGLLERYQQERDPGGRHTAVLPAPSGIQQTQTSVWSPWCRPAKPTAAKGRFWTRPSRLPPLASPSRSRQVRL